MTFILFKDLEMATTLAIQQRNGKRKDDSRNLVKNFYVYRDSNEKYQRAIKVTINPKKFRNVENLLTEMTQRMPDIPFGVRSICTPLGRRVVKNLNEIKNGAYYICSPLQGKARGIDLQKVAEPPRWNFARPPSGRRLYSLYLRSQMTSQRNLENNGGRTIRNGHKGCFPYPSENNLKGNLVQYVHANIPRKIYFVRTDIQNGNQIGNKQPYFISKKHLNQNFTFKRFLAEIGAIFQVHIDTISAKSGEKV